MVSAGPSRSSRTSSPFCALGCNRTGSSMPNHPSADQNTFLHYLARYPHRVAISNHRLLAISDSAVSFRWKDYAHGSKPRTMTLSARVSAALPAACITQRLPAHPLFRLVGQPHPQTSAATLPFSAPPVAASNPGIVLEPAYYLALSSLPRPHVRPPTTHPCPDPLRGNQTCMCL